MRRLMLVLAVLLALITVNFSAEAFSISQARNIRVGFFMFDGYQNIDSRSYREGYGYEYLQELSKYNNWRYDYVIGSWQECLTMLEHGEIDMLTSAQKTPERQEKFWFSSQSMGESRAMITVRSDDERFAAGVSSLQGMTVGMLEGSSRNEHLDDWCERNGVAVQKKYFADEDLLLLALKSHSVDAVLTSDLRRTNDETVLAKFAPAPFYIMLRQEDKQLQQETDRAMEQLGLDNPLFAVRLHNKFYNTGSRSAIVLTQEEKDYINSGAVIRAVVPPDRAPLSSFNGIAAEGILPELLREISRQSGLNIEFVKSDSFDDARRKFLNDEVDMMEALPDDYNWAERNNVLLTHVGIVSTYSMLSLKETQQVDTIAAIPGDDFTLKYVEQRYSPNSIKYFPRLKDCVAAVRNGSYSAVYLDSYVAQKLVNDDMDNKLQLMPVSNYYYNLMMGVKRSNRVLFSILNKYINRLDQKNLADIIIDKTAYKRTDNSFFSVLHDDPRLMIQLSIATFVLLAGVMAVVFGWIVSRQKRTIMAAAARFGRIGSALYVGISEIDAATGEHWKFSFENEQLQKMLVEPLWDESGRLQCLKDAYVDDLTIFEENLNKKQLIHLAFTRKNAYFEGRAKDENGEYRWYSYMVQGLPGRQKSSRIMMYKRDIDQYKCEQESKNRQMQENLLLAEAASRAKGDFMSRMSHEIRTPLNVILGFMTIAKGQLTDAAKVRDCLDKAETASRYLLTIINDILDMSAIESGKIKIANEKFDLHQVIRAVSSIYYIQCSQKELNYSVDVHNLVDNAFIGDAARINQVLLNLLSNAVKFTPAGGTVTLTVSQGILHDGMVHMRFMVSDTGIGMTKEFMNRIFKPFEQQNGNIMQKYGGTGLGLSITKNLIELMRGAVQVVSEVGKGTTFIVELPLKLVADDWMNTLDSQYKFTGSKILVVSDDFEYAQRTMEILGKFAVNSYYAMPWQLVDEAVRAQKEGCPYDLCIIDWEMRDMNGREAEAQLVEALGMAAVPKIVFAEYEFTAGKHDDSGRENRYFVSKPLFPSSLFNMLMDIFMDKPGGKISGNDAKVDFTGKTALLVEDNELNREIGIELLKQVGFAIDTAENGAVAVEKYNASPENYYDVILMDIQMPVMDGYEAARLIRQGKRSDAASIPIIAMTANAFAEDVAKSLAVGMDNHLSKPVDLPEMYKMLKFYCP